MQEIGDGFCGVVHATSPSIGRKTWKTNYAGLRDEAEPGRAGSTAEPRLRSGGRTPRRYMYIGWLTAAGEDEDSTPGRGCLASLYASRRSAQRKPGPGRISALQNVQQLSATGIGLTARSGDFRGQQRVATTKDIVFRDPRSPGSAPGVPEGATRPIQAVRHHGRRHYRYRRGDRKSRSRRASSRRRRGG